MKEIPIMEIGVLLAASKNRQYRLSIYESFKVLVTFLQANGLTNRELLAENIATPPDNFCLYESDLTADGVKLIDDIVPRWFTWIERGNDMYDISILEKGLKKIRDK